MKKEDYEKLYEEYKKLKEKIDDAFQVRKVILGKPIEIKMAPLMKDMYRYREIKKILIQDGKKYLNLNPKEWHEIYKGI